MRALSRSGIDGGLGRAKSSQRNPTQALEKASEIQEFCTTQYDVTFPLFEKIDVNGANAHPLYEYLKRQQSGLLGSSIKWNFTKFLVDRRGKVIARHAPTARPEGLRRQIETLL